MQHCYFIYKQQTSAPDRLFRQASLPPLVGHILAKAGSGICIEGLRRSRIDELPQIINILRGEISWIGPRPEALPLSRWYQSEIPFYRYRHIVRPGITGWAQVSQGHVLEIEDVMKKLSYDFFYISNFSPWIDLLIVVRTIKTMLTGFGSR